MNSTQLKEILHQHELWVRDEGGNKAELYPGTDLSEGDLSYAVLEEASLSGVKLHKADLRGAILVGVDLSKADLTEADFTDADLHGTDFSGADLRGAKFTTEMRIAGGLLKVMCDDDQLPWLIGHEYFSRRF